ncbi:MAG: hypothetical protein ABI315_05815 [Bacteroidia bacterium]
MKLFKSTILFGLGFVGVIFLFEILLSWGGILEPIVNIDSKKGESYIPNKVCSSIFVAEGFGLAKTNSAGWFGREYIKKQPNDYSVAVVGNSFVASRQVFYRDNFLSLAEKELDDKYPQQNTYFYNFGKEDLPLSQLLFIKEGIDSLCSPNKIIVLINDESFDDNSRRFVPYYNLIDGELKLNTSFKDAFFVKIYEKYNLITKSAVAFLGFRSKNRLPQTKEILFDKFVAPTKNTNESESDGHSGISPLDLAIIANLEKDNRVIFALDLNKELTSELRSVIKKSPIIELHEPLLKFKQTTGIDPYYWKLSELSGHWNLEGHKIVAKEIANSICELRSH